MRIDFFYLTVSSFIFLIYASVCAVSVIFTFSIEYYRKLDEALKIDLFTMRIINPLGRNIDTIDNWLIEHNVVVGTFLTLVSVIDLKLWFDIINNIY